MLKKKNSGHDTAGSQEIPPHLDTSAYVSIRQHTSACVSIRQLTAVRCQHTSAYVSIRQHTSVQGGLEGGGPKVWWFAGETLGVLSSAYASIRQHTPA
jgi:hypothetical protein